MPVHAIANIRASEAIKTYLEKIWIAKDSMVDRGEFEHSDNLRNNQ